MNLFRIIRVIIPILAGCGLLGSVIFGVITALFVATAKSTTATITASETEQSDSDDTLYQPTFVFSVSGRDYSVTPLAYVAPSPGNVGDQIPVLYDPRHPQNARIDAFGYTWAMPVVLLGLAIMFGSIHFAIAYIARQCHVKPSVG